MQSDFYLKPVEVAVRKNTGLKRFCIGFTFQTQELCPYFRLSVVPAQSVSGQHLDVLGSDFGKLAW